MRERVPVEAATAATTWRLSASTTRLPNSRMRSPTLDQQMPKGPRRMRAYPTGSEAVVMVSLSDSDAMEETAHLLSSTANTRRLADAIDELEAGQGMERQLFVP